MKIKNFFTVITALMAFSVPSFAQDAVLDSVAFNDVEVASDTIKPDLTKEPVKKVSKTDWSKAVPAKFKGKDVNGFKYWVQDRVEYPRQAFEDKAQGRLKCEFTVGEDGKITSVKILETPHRSLGAEVTRIIKNSPKWTPATGPDGRPCRNTFSMVIDFSLVN